MNRQKLSFRFSHPSFAADTRYNSQRMFGCCLGARCRNCLSDQTRSFLVETATRHPRQSFRLWLGSWLVRSPPPDHLQVDLDNQACRRPDHISISFGIWPRLGQIIEISHHPGCFMAHWVRYTRRQPALTRRAQGSLLEIPS